MDRPPESGAHAPTDSHEEPEETVLLALSQEVEGIQRAHADALSRNAEVEHLAGLSAHAIAQELIDRFGAMKVLNAIAHIRREGKEYFIDLICALLPAVCTRRAFCARVLQNLESERAAHPVEHMEETSKERYLRFCLAYDRYPIACVPILNRLHRRACKQQLVRTYDGSLVAHLHLASLPRDFDPSHYRDVLAASGNNLATLQRVETQRMEEALARIERRCSAVRSTIQHFMSGQRGTTERDWQPQIRAMEDDVNLLEQAAATLQSPAAQRIQQNAIERVRIALKDARQICEEEVQARCAPFSNLLHALPRISVHVHMEPTGNGANNRKKHGTNGTTPSPEAKT